MSHLVWYTRGMIIETDMKDKLFEVRIATWSDGTITTTHIKAHDLAHAERIAKRKWGTTRVSEVQESTQKIEDNFSDMMPTAEEFWYDAQPEPYEPSCYDGTYSEM